MTADDGDNSLVTRVARALYGDNLFCGYSASRELVGRDGFWSIASLAVGAPRLNAKDQAFLDEVSTAVIAADPRIWPLKITRLLSAYGGLYAGVCGGLLPMESARMGPSAVGPAAEQLQNLRKKVGPAPYDRHRVVTAIQELLAARVRVFGYGVYHRAEDERLTLLRSTVGRHRREGGEHWVLHGVMAEAIQQLSGVPPNVVGGLAALLLDLGFSPHQIDALSTAFLFTNYLANAVEGAAQAPAVLRELPPEAVDYQGTPPRRSGRAKAAAKK